jgi:putative membrane protein
MSGFGHMGWLNGWGMGFGMILWLAIAALIIAGLVWLVRSQPIRGGQRHSTGLDVLDERYARGEITRDEYLRMKRDITE